MYLKITNSKITMKFTDYKYFIFSDLYRITGKIKISLLLKNLFVGEGYKYNFWMRTCRFTKNNMFMRLTLYPVSRIMLHHYKYKFGISIPFRTEVGSGFYIGHFGNIIVSENSKIGKNCNISQGVTLGQVNRGKKIGCPTIGDNVYIGPGAKIVGAVKIGNNVAIGANCVVLEDVPDHAVVVGVPGRIISQNGSKGYVNRTDYEDKIL
jgi:serine O-acetyltransferase